MSNYDLIRTFVPTYSQTTVRRRLHLFTNDGMEKKRLALKKLMEAVEHELLKKPNTKTLDRLSMLAGFQDWQSFQDALHGQADARTNYDGQTKEKAQTQKR